MTGWTASAHLLADDIREPGFSAAAVNASAWRARVDPAAARGLIAAALALTSGDAGPALWAAAKPCPDDKTMLEQAAELEGAAAGLLARASRLAAGCRGALESACSAAGDARAAVNAAATTQARSDAEGALGAARALIADCEAALEIVDETGTRLAHAVNCLRRVPDDLAGTYEVPYQHVRDGGELPHSGDFLTGGNGIVTIEAA